MNARALLLSRVAEANAPSPFRQDDMPVDDQCRTAGETSVGESRLSDSEREDAIYRAGNAMEAWYSRFRMSGNSVDLEIAYRYLEIMRALVTGRSAQQIARMEQERGIA